MEFDHQVVQWVTSLSSVLMLLGAVVGTVFAFYRYVRKDIDSRINERFAIIEADLARHIDEGELSLQGIRQEVADVKRKNQEIVDNYKHEFKTVHELIGDVRQAITVTTGDIKGDVAVLATKLDMFFKYLNKEDKDGSNN